MIINSKSYPAMKDSGVEWLGDVPKHWEVKKLRSILRSAIKRNCPDLPLLSVTRKKGVILRDIYSREENHNFIPDNLSNYKVVRTGQFAMNKMKAWQGSYGISQHDGIVSPAYFIFDIDHVQGDFFHTAIRSKAYVPFFTSASDGVRIGQWDLSQARMREITFSIPPLAEQTAIARYLDYVGRRVRQVIWAKEKLIGLLDEQKQAIIHHAVTRGLDPDVPLKSSGVEWLGRVPEHWDVRQLGRIGRFSKGSGGSKEDEVSNGIPCVRYGDLYTQHELFIRESKAYVTSKRAISYTPIKYGDILFAGSGETIDEIGKSAVNLISGSACCGGDVILFRPLIDVDAKFSGYATNCPQTTYQKSCMGRGVTVMHVYSSELKYVWVTLPPLTEQAAIVEYLDKATTDIDTTIARARREIELLREYRTRLIADVVTGKIDVRKVAAQLPNETEDQNK